MKDIKIKGGWLTDTRANVCLNKACMHHPDYEGTGGAL